MAQPTGTFDTFAQIGIREDLSDIIWNIAPTDTPFGNGIPHVEASSTNHEWQTDTLAAAAENKAIQGDDAPQDSATATTRLGNRTMIATKDARVSGTGRSVDTAGRADELDYQVMLRGEELKRDWEVNLTQNNAKVTGNATTASEMAGLPAWLATNTSRGTGGSDPTGDGTDAATNGTQRAFTEDLLRTVLRSCWDEGGNPDVIMVGSFNKQKLSEFTGGNTFMQKSEDGTLHTAIDVYQSDFGDLRVIPNRFSPARDAFVLEMDKFALATLPGRNMLSFDLSKTGDSDAKQILIEGTLEARNEAASGVVADLTTS
ncbi:DUF5309 domain-containing protein [candidate division KSB1 bacterium]|nr:DUF5309 domain-containing protein [candidate division KSB1 bacterium]NIV68733.1 head protein [Phycisphaerae bacterium]NIS25452.1 DUF5309 domain-containing protein [candidate division KSB1 bacterium]NIT72344.1 DUF5309 domain-containing protein [candidate division KSB1 bacterium]NIU26129.1 DUF5309 domain-containing protein [candidate division KSB1 bacterium]